MGHKRLIGYWLVLWWGLALACNAPVGPAVATPPPIPPTLTVTATIPVELTRGAPATAPVLTPAAISSATTLPTSTPIRPTLAPTLAPTVTPRVQPTVPAAGPSRTPTAQATIGPLTFGWEITWRLDPANPLQAIAHVAIYPQGGNGFYTYYHDDLPAPGPVFEYQWAICRGNPGSLRVDSGDGQTAHVNYYENPPCPTPTPLP